MFNSLNHHWLTFFLSGKFGEGGAAGKKETELLCKFLSCLGIFLCYNLEILSSHFLCHSNIYTLLSSFLFSWSPQMKWEPSQLLKTNQHNYPLLWLPTQFQGHQTRQITSDHSLIDGSYLLLVAIPLFQLQRILAESNSLSSLCYCLVFFFQSIEPWGRR